MRLARLLAPQQIRGQRGGDEEDRRDIRARVPDTAEKIAVEREKQRRAAVRSSESIVRRPIQATITTMPRPSATPSSRA